MPDTTRIGDSRVIFGVTDDPHGFVKAETEEVSVSKAMATSRGTVKAVDFYNKMTHVTGQYTYFAGVNGPHQHVGDGTAITMATSGLTIYIEKSTKNWEEAGYVNISFDGYYYANLGS